MDSDSQIERSFWNQIASHQDSTEIYLPAYLKSTLACLGNTENKTILDCACGFGLASAILAHNSTVYAFDISEEMVKQAKIIAEKYGVEKNTHFDVMDFYNMTYNDEQFDLVFGGFVIHHLSEKRKAGKEVHRVLRKGGKAYFIETWSGNPLIRVLRPLVLKLSQNLNNMASPGEEPLSHKDIETFCKPFTSWQIIFPYFIFWEYATHLSQLSIFKGSKKHCKFFWTSFERILKFLDHFIYKYLPFLRKYSYYVLIEAEK